MAWTELPHLVQGAVIFVFFGIVFLIGACAICGLFSPKWQNFCYGDDEKPLEREDD